MVGSSRYADERLALVDASARNLALLATAMALDAGDGWDGSVLANPDAVALALEALESEIARMRGAIQRGDAGALRELSAAAEVLARGVAR